MRTQSGAMVWEGAVTTGRSVHSGARAALVSPMCGDTATMLAATATPATGHSQRRSRRTGCGVIGVSSRRSLPFIPFP